MSDSDLEPEATEPPRAPRPAPFDAWVAQEAALLGEQVRARAWSKARMGQARELLRRLWAWEQAEAPTWEEAVALVAECEELREAHGRLARFAFWRRTTRRLRRGWPLRLRCLREAWFPVGYAGAEALAQEREQRREVFEQNLKHLAAQSQGRGRPRHVADFDFPIVEKQGRT